jgi:hypothetical protein
MDEAQKSEDSAAPSAFFRRPRVRRPNRSPTRDTKSGSKGYRPETSFTVQTRHTFYNRSPRTAPTGTEPIHNPTKYFCPQQNRPPTRNSTLAGLSLPVPPRETMRRGQNPANSQPTPQSGVSCFTACQSLPFSQLQLRKNIHNSLVSNKPLAKSATIVAETGSPALAF